MICTRIIFPKALPMILLHTLYIKKYYKHQVICFSLPALSLLLLRSPLCPFKSTNVSKASNEKIIMAVYFLQLCAWNSRWDKHPSLLSALAGWEWHGHCVFLCQSGQLLEEFWEYHCAVNRVFHAQRLSLLLQPRRPCAHHHAPEEDAVQRLTAIPDVGQSCLSRMPCPRRTVSVPQDQIAQRWLPTLHCGKERNIHWYKTQDTGPCWYKVLWIIKRFKRCWKRWTLEKSKWLGVSESVLWLIVSGKPDVICFWYS